jgi:riboflavin kinase/FMN adenylyltransferase
LKLYNCIKDFKPVPNPVVTIGTFDGVHVGHQEVFNQMKKEAKKLNGETVVITFHPHPRLVLGKDSENLKFIKTERKKFEHIDKAGIDNLVIVNFTKEFSKQSSEQFVKDLIVDYIHPKLMIIGYDHHFGKDRQGSFENLKLLGTKYGFDVEKVHEQNIDGNTISSTRIRNLLSDGNVEEANELLGHEYSITGKVVKGKSIGHNLGFPTANIEVEDQYKLIAAVGVYACRVSVKGKLYLGMSNIGYRPTIEYDNGVEHDITIEINIFEFDQDIYGEEITIFFVARMRNEKKFESKQALIDQLKIDKRTALKILN